MSLWASLKTNQQIREQIVLEYSPRQELFMEAEEPEQLYGGAKGGGKSYALCLKAILLSLMYPGNRGGLFRHELKDLKESLLVTFRKVCPPQLIIQENKTEGWFQLYTGRDKPPSTIVYGGLGDEHQIESVKGKEFGFIGIDEPAEVDINVYRMMLAQLRWILPDGTRPRYQALLTSNPEPGWVEERFRHLILQASATRPLCSDGRATYIRALPTDNPHLAPEALAWMQTMPDAWRAKYLEGSWEVSEGQVYKEFDRQTHCIVMPPPAFLQTLKLVASIDHATTGITCMAVDGIDPDGNVFALGSYYEENKLISEHVVGMKALMDRFVLACGKQALSQTAPANGMYPATAAFDYILIDPSTQAKTLQSKDRLQSVQEEYIRHGIPTQPAWNALDAGINLMQEYLHVKPNHIHPLTQKRGSPSWFVVAQENQQGIREIIGWCRKMKPSGLWDYGNRPDHWLDNQRYILMSRPMPPRVTTGDLRATGDSLSDTITRMAMRSIAGLDSKFKAPGAESGQWFGGGSGKSNAWFPKP